MYLAIGRTWQGKVVGSSMMSFGMFKFKTLTMGDKMIPVVYMIANRYVRGFCFVIINL